MMLLQWFGPDHIIYKIQVQKFLQKKENNFFLILTIKKIKFNFNIFIGRNNKKYIK